jgi:hypothetical protein
MSERDLQRLTNSVDYIDHGPIPRRAIPARRNHVTQKVKVPMESCPNVPDMRVDSYIVVVTTAPGNSIWAARKRSMIALLSSP